MARTPDYSHEAKLDHEMLVQRLDYNETTGVWRWKKRPPEDFRDPGACFTWNHTYANSEAGSYGYRGQVIINLFKTVYRAERLAVFYVTGRWPKDVTLKNGVKNDLRYRNLVATFEPTPRVRLSQPAQPFGRIHYRRAVSNPAYRTKNGGRNAPTRSTAK